MNAPKSKRRYLRLSLRSLLLLLTVLAVSLGVYLIRVQDQVRAVAMIERLGGRCWYTHEVDENRIVIPAPRQPSAPKWLRSLLSDHFFTTVIMVSLNETQFTDDDLELLVGLRHLQRLDLDRPSVTDASLEHISRITSLQELHLFDTLVTDQGLAQIARLNQLTTLTLSVSRISDDGLVHLSNLSELERLYMSNNEVTDAGLKHLSALRSLKEVQAYNTQVTSAGGAQSLPGVQVGTGSSAVASPLRSR